MILRFYASKTTYMLVPFIAFLVVLFFVIRFLVLAGKKKSENRDLGDRRAGT